MNCRLLNAVNMISLSNTIGDDEVEILRSDFSRQILSVHGLKIVQRVCTTKGESLFDIVKGSRLVFKSDTTLHMKVEALYNCLFGVADKNCVNSVPIHVINRCRMSCCNGENISKPRRKKDVIIGWYMDQMSKYL